MFRKKVLSIISLSLWCLHLCAGESNKKVDIHAKAAEAVRKIQARSSQVRAQVNMAIELSRLDENSQEINQVVVQGWLGYLPKSVDPIMETAARGNEAVDEKLYEELAKSESEAPQPKQAIFGKEAVAMLVAAIEEVQREQANSDIAIEIEKAKNIEKAKS